MELAAALAALLALAVWLGSILLGFTRKTLVQTESTTGSDRLITMTATVEPRMPVLACLLVFQAFVILAAWRLAKHGGMRAADVLALRAPLGGAKTTLAIAAVAVAFLAVENAAASFLYRLAAEDAAKFVAGLVAEGGWPLAIVTIGGGAPIAEEVWLRGFLLSALAKTRLGFWRAGVVMSAVFAGLHAAQYALVLLAPTFLIGLVITWTLGLTGSLWVPIAIHMFNNLFALFILWMWPPI
jgi:membrane protease YdiL (CAAX protease family)